jgi:hypothetical protein
MVHFTDTADIMRCFSLPDILDLRSMYIEIYLLETVFSEHILERGGGWCKDSTPFIVYTPSKSSTHTTAKRIFYCESSGNLSMPTLLDSSP